MSGSSFIVELPPHQNHSLPPDFLPYDFEDYTDEEWYIRKWEVFACVPLAMWFIIGVMISVH